LGRHLTSIAHPRVELSEEGDQFVAAAILGLEDLTGKQHR
jgi:hypothetical protein